MKRIGRVSVLTLCALGIFFSMGAYAAPRYEITDLGALLGVDYSFASSINSKGLVTGNADGQLFVYDPSAGVKVLGDGLNASAINASGAIAGDNSSRGFVYSNGEMQWMTSLPGGRLTFATAINDEGLVAGAATDSTGRFHAVLRGSDGKTQDLGVLAGKTDSALYAINNHGVAAGTGYSAWGENPNMPNRAFRTTASGLQALPLLAGGTSSSASAINDLGDILGYGDNASGQVVGIVWRDGVAFELPSMDPAVTTTALDINNLGQAVGQAWVRSDWLRGVLFEEGKISYIDDLVGAEYLNGWSFDAAVGINDRGQIVGAGLLNGDVHAYVLTPVSVPVPEPESMALFLTGLAGLAFAQRKWGRR